MFPHPSLAGECLRPGAVSTHFSRFAAKQGVKTTFHKLRHYNATELLKAGVPIEVVSRRLGHSSTETTRKFYAAWCPEADPAAATVASGVVATRVAARPPITKLRQTVAMTLANQLRASIEAGDHAPGAHLPTMQQLSLDHRVSINGAHAAVNLLADWGFVTVSRGKRTTVTDPAQWPASTTTTSDDSANEVAGEAPALGGEAAGALNAAAADLAPVVGRIGPQNSWSPPVTDDERPEAAEGDQPRDDRLVQVTARCGRTVIKTVYMEASTGTAADVRRLVRNVKANLFLEPSLDGVVELDIVDFNTDTAAMTFVLGPAHSLRTEVAAG